MAKKKPSKQQKQTPPDITALKGKTEPVAPSADQPGAATGEERPFLGSQIDLQALFALLGGKEYDLQQARVELLNRRLAFKALQTRVEELEELVRSLQKPKPKPEPANSGSPEDKQQA